MRETRREERSPCIISAMQHAASAEEGCNQRGAASPIAPSHPSTHTSSARQPTGVTIPRALETDVRSRRIRNDASHSAPTASSTYPDYLWQPSNGRIRSTGGAQHTRY
eukprot:2389889-Pleurochrysis_carterae.AAC.1